MSPRIVQVRERILKHNDELARAMRREFAAAGVFVVNLVSGPGAGKTELLTRTLAALLADFRCAAVVGDLATENDARRLATSGARSSRSSRARCATSRPRWSGRRSPIGIFRSWTFC